MPTAPHLLGFAEPVTQVPPIEDFLPAGEETAPAATAVEPVEVAAPEPDPPPAQPEPAPEPAPHSAPIRARVRDLPPLLPAAPLPAATPPERPTNLVGRLGRRLGEIYSPNQEVAPRFEPLPPPTSAPAARKPEPPPARQPVEPAVKLTTPAPAPLADRGGRPSLPRNRRLYRRAALPAEIEIDGVPCTLIDVSIGGFAATGVPQLEPNALVPIMLRIVIDGIEVGTLLKARIIYVTQGRSSGRFIELSPSQMAFLRYIVTWRGESVGAVGTTTLLDAISGGSERGFALGAAARSDTEPKSRWWAGLIGRGVKPPR